LESPLSTAQLSREPYGWAHYLVETRKTPTSDEYLAEVFALTNATTKMHLFRR